MEGPGNARLDISPSGDVAIKGDNTLFLNFGQEARAQSFLERRLAQGFEGTQIKTFQVPTSYVMGCVRRRFLSRWRGSSPAARSWWT